MQSARTLSTILSVVMLIGCQDRDRDTKKGVNPSAGSGAAPTEDDRSARPPVKEKKVPVSEKEAKANEFILTKGATLVDNDGHVVEVSLRLLGERPSAIWNSLKEMPKLEILNLSDALFKDNDLAGLDSVKQLKTLSLSTVVTLNDAELVHLKGLTQLTTLNLDHTFITDAGLAHLKGLTKLEKLDLTSTSVTEAGIKDLKRSLLKVNITHDSKKGKS
jgi:hypothetical protein